MFSPRILSVSFDISLARARQMLLENEGYVVVTVCTQGAALQHCRRPDFDLVILGHSLRDSQRDEIIRSLRSRSSLPILALLRPNESPILSATRSVNAMEPGEVVSAVREMLRKRPQARSASGNGGSSSSARSG